tara:strand:- start:1683 stop:2165 length:483 start_codon:yes stop_codon:yes gene_type:complete
MRAGFFASFLMMLSMTPSTQAFPVYKIVRVNCKILKRQTYRVLAPRMSVITENETELVERSISILSDNAINEMLYLLKFYHMTNDASSSVLYIISYELIWVAYQLHKKNLLSKNAFDLTNTHSKQLLQQVLLNVTLYIILKNLVINNIFSEINKGYIHGM